MINFAPPDGVPWPEVIITKLDGHAKGGGALSAVSATWGHPRISGSELDQKSRWENAFYIIFINSYIGTLEGLPIQLPTMGIACYCLKHSVLIAWINILSKCQQCWVVPIGLFCPLCQETPSLVFMPCGSALRNSPIIFLGTGEHFDESLGWIAIAPWVWKDPVSIRLVTILKVRWLNELMPDKSIIWISRLDGPSAACQWCWIIYKCIYFQASWSRHLRIGQSHCWFLTFPGGKTKHHRWNPDWPSIQAAEMIFRAEQYLPLKHTGQ